MQEGKIFLQKNSENRSCDGTITDDGWFKILIW